MLQKIELWVKRLATRKVKGIEGYQKKILKMSEPILMSLVMIEFHLLMNKMITILMQCALNNLELYVVTSKPNNETVLILGNNFKDYKYLTL